MIADYRIPIVHRFRSNLSVIVSPFQYVVDFPIRLMNWISVDLTSRERLLQENTKQQAYILLLKAALQKQYAIESENQQLRKLLGSRKSIHNKVTIAQLLAVSSDFFRREVILNKGSFDKIFIGQPVMDATGVMGQVVAVNPLTSRVMLITDARSSIPLEIKRNHKRVIASGVPSLGLLRLNSITSTDDVLKGDELITSGLGERYPYGYPVGKIILIRHKSGMTFSDVLIKPSAQLNSSRIVLLLWNNKDRLHISN